MNNNNWHMYLTANNGKELDKFNDKSLRNILGLNSMSALNYAKLINMIRCYILFHGNENLDTSRFTNILTDGISDPNERVKLLTFISGLKSKIRYIAILKDNSIDNFEFTNDTQPDNQELNNPKIVYACMEDGDKNIKIPLGIVSSSNECVYNYTYDIFEQRCSMDYESRLNKHVGQKPITDFGNDVRVLDEGKIIAANYVKNYTFEKNIKKGSESSTENFIKTNKGKAFIAITDDVYASNDELNNKNKEQYNSSHEVTNMYDNVALRWMSVQHKVDLEDIILFQNYLYNFMRDPIKMRSQKDKKTDKSFENAKTSRDFQDLAKKVMP